MADRATYAVNSDRRTERRRERRAAEICEQRETRLGGAFGYLKIILVTADHYGRAGANPRVRLEYGNEIHCTYILSPSFKKTQSYLVIVSISENTLLSRHNWI